MRLALRELSRRPGRFATAAIILTLIALLLMFLGALLDGLIASSTGAIRAQDAQAIVYSDTADSSLQRSRIEPDVRSEVESLPDADEVGGLGVVQLGARVPGKGPRDLVGVALFGYELAPRGVPSTPEPGVAYADDTLRAEGVEVGMVIELGPARTPIEIAGFVSDTEFNGQASLWAAPATWRETLSTNRPDARLAEGVFQALVVRGSTDLPAQIDQTTDGATESLTVDEAVDAIPGVEQQRTTFAQIIGVTLLVALVVVALFFALITVERLGLYGVLKALGARSSTIFAGLLAQALVVSLLAVTIAAGAVIGLDRAIPPGSVPLAVTGSRIATSAALIGLAAAAGCAFSLRRVLRVDPATAIGGGS